MSEKIKIFLFLYLWTFFCDSCPWRQRISSCYQERRELELSDFLFQRMVKETITNTFGDTALASFAVQRWSWQVILSFDERFLVYAKIFCGKECSACLNFFAALRHLIISSRTSSMYMQRNPLPIPVRNIAKCIDAVKKFANALHMHIRRWTWIFGIKWRERQRQNHIVWLWCVRKQTCPQLLIPKISYYGIQNVRAFKETRVWSIVVDHSPKVWLLVPPLAQFAICLPKSKPLTPSMANLIFSYALVTFLGHQATEK